MSSIVTFVCETPGSRAFAADCLYRLAQSAGSMTADITEVLGALRISVSMSATPMPNESNATDGAGVEQSITESVCWFESAPIPFQASKRIKRRSSGPL